MTIIEDKRLRDKVFLARKRGKLRKGLETLSSIALPGQRKIVVLGRMAALGKYADEEYEKAGHLIGDLAIDVLITKGAIAKDFAKPAIEAGVKSYNVYHFSDVDEMKRFSDSFLIPNDNVYFKTAGNNLDFDDVIDYLRRKGGIKKEAFLKKTAY